MSWRWMMRAMLVLAGVGGFAGIAGAADSVMMDRPDGTKQCEPAGRVATVRAVRAELHRAGVKPLHVRHLKSDGRMRMQMCGAPTGAVFRIRVRLEQRDRAAGIGFVETAEKLER